MSTLAAGECAIKLWLPPSVADDGFPGNMIYASTPWDETLPDGPPSATSQARTAGLALVALPGEV
jgi:hypothetical protein